MNNYLRLFFSTKGTINKRTFWHGLIVITAVNTALFGASVAWVGAHWPVGHQPQTTGAVGIQFGYLAVCPTLWSTLCVFIKRLRAVGAQAWSAIVGRGLVTVGLASFAIVTWLGERHGQIVPSWLTIVILPGMLCLLVGYLWDLVLIIWLGIFSKSRQPDVAEVFN